MPQIILVTLMGINLVASVLRHGESRGNYNAYTGMVDICIVLGLLHWGGFFS